MKKAYKAKHLFIALILAASTAIVHADAGSDFRIQPDRDGKIPWNMQQIGVMVLPASIISTTPYLVSGGSIAIDGVMTATAVSAGSAGSLEIRSSNTANISTELLIPGLSAASTTANTFYFFSPPLVCPDGASVNSTSSSARFAMFYHLLSTAYPAGSTVQDYLIPSDVAGQESFPGFHGTAVSSQVSPGGAANDALSTEGLDFNSNSRIVDTAPGFFWGTISSTGAASTNFLLTFDSASIVGVGANQHFLPPFFYNATNTVDAVSELKTKFFQFPWPLRYNNGLVVTNSASTGRLRVLRAPKNSLR